MPQPGRSRRRRGLPEAPERETRPAQRREREACGAAARVREADAAELEPPHGSRRPNVWKESGGGAARESARELAKVDSVSAVHARAHKSRGTPSRRTPAYSREVFVVPGKDARPSPSRMDLRDFLFWVANDGAMSGVGPPARRARLCAAVGARAGEADGAARKTTRRRGARGAAVVGTLSQRRRHTTSLWSHQKFQTKLCGVNQTTTTTTIIPNQDS